MMMSTARRQISQKTFDECVAENVEEFDMSPAEAVAEAIQQFQSQGVDLSNVIKIGMAPAAGEQESLPMRLKRLIGDLEKHSLDKSEDENLLFLVGELHRACEKAPEARVVAGRHNAVNTIHALLETTNPAVVIASSNLLVLLCASNTENQDFVGSLGMQRLVQTLQHPWEDTETVIQVLTLLKATCAKHESNKAYVTKAGGVKVLCEYLNQADDNPKLSRHLAQCFRVLTINDDPRATFSQAQDTIKCLVDCGLIPYTLRVLRHIQSSEKARVSSESPDLLVQWLAVLKQLAVTEDICRQIADLKGLITVHDIMQTYEHSAAIAKRCITVFRNMAAADDFKSTILQSGGVKQTLLVMHRHQADASIQQNACATLAAIALRSPTNSRALIELGAARQISRAIKIHCHNVAVLRQASLAVRNIVARSIELRSRFLHDEPEIEPLLREAQQYRGCGDEAYAALRDLGCKIQLSSFGATAGTSRSENAGPCFNPVQIESTQIPFI